MKIFLLLILFSLQINIVQAAEWKLLEDDLWKLEHPKLILYKTNLKKFDLSINKLPTFSTDNPPSSTELLMNASFFDTDFNPLGLILEKGAVLNKVHLGGSVLTGVLIKKNDFLAIKHRDQLNLARLSSLDFALQAGPRILADGKILSMKNSEKEERRSGICLNQNRDLIIYITTKNAVINFTDLQDILLDTEIGCFDALNLDGGSSTQYYFYQEGKLSDSIIGFSTVPVFLRLSHKAEL